MSYGSRKARTSVNKKFARENDSSFGIFRLPLQFCCFLAVFHGALFFLPKSLRDGASVCTGL